MGKLMLLPNGVRRLTWTMSPARSNGNGLRSSALTMVKTSSVRADPQPEDNGGRQREDRRASQRAEGESKIVH
jgi:hypothetical protein